MSSRVLLIHSGGLTSRQWRKLGADLAPNHDVLIPDLLGYGEQERWPAGQPFHFRDDVAHLANVLDGVPAHIVGHSYGGLLALQLALSHPGVIRSIAVYEPVAFGVLRDDAEARTEINKITAYAPDEHGHDEAWLRGFVDWWQGPGVWATLSAKTQQSFRDVGWKLSQEVASLSADITDAGIYGTIHAATLLLAGAKTQPLELRVCEGLAAALPNATLTVFPEYGHMGPITHADEVNAVIADFVNSH